MRSLLLVALMAHPALAADVTPAVPTVTVTAEAKVVRIPDVATVTAGVTTQSPQAVLALAENSRRMASVVAALSRAGVAPGDVQTSQLSLQPQYSYAQSEPQQLTSYQASNQVSIRLRHPDRAGAVIDALVGAGANTVGGPEFTIYRPDAALDEARAEAVRQARARADLYARASGLTIKRVVSITEASANQPRPMMRAMVAQSQRPTTPLAAGEVELAASVTIVYELQ